MLEVELQSLRTEVTALREAINSLTATMIGVGHAALPTTPITPVVPPTTEPEGIQPVETPAPAPVTVESLQEFCTSLVRKDQGLKSQIKQIIASFDGAKVISKVPTDRLPELKAALEALQ